MSTIFFVCDGGRYRSYAAAVMTAERVGPEVSTLEVYRDMLLDSH